MSSWQYSPGSTTYVYARPQVRAAGRIRTSPTEISHITIAALVLTVDIMIIWTRLPTLVGTGLATVGQILSALAFGAAAALTGFLFHELAHKFVAERRGYNAEFRMSPIGLAISFFTALLGFLFAAPGATVVQGMYDRRDWGITSLAGPALNLAEGVAFFAAGYVVFTFDGNAALASTLLLLAFINGWFATFNLIPVGPLDGRKVLSWSVPAWILFFAVSAIIAGAAFFVNAGVVSF